MIPRGLRDTHRERASVPPQHKRVGSAPNGAVRGDWDSDALHFGFGILKTLAIIPPIFGVLMLSLIAVHPGHISKEFVEGLRNRLC